jgi:hypothetical protein
MQDMDFLYAALGVGAVWLIFKNTKPLSEGIVQPVARTIQAAETVTTPLLSALGKGVAIVTNPESYKTEWDYIAEAPYTPTHALRALKENPFNLNYWLNVPYSVIHSWGKGWSN